MLNNRVTKGLYTAGTLDEPLIHLLNIHRLYDFVSKKN